MDEKQSSPGAGRVASQAWAQFAQEPALLPAVIECSSALVVVLDAGGRIVQTNRACSEITGYSREELAGRTLWDVFASPEAKAREHARFQAMVSARATANFESDWMIKSGEPRRISLRNAILADERGAVRYVIATGMDITSRQMAEQEQVKSEMQFRLVWHATHEPMCLTDQHGGILQANEAFARAAGRPAHSLAGVEFATLFEPSDQQNV